LTNEESATPKVSVLMTCYNAASTIEESVRSVIAQTFTNWELVLVDDLSDDNSMELIEKLGDPRIKIKKLPTRHRRTKALNQGFRLCIGAYIAVLDADDIAHPTRFEKQVRLLDSDPSLVGVGTWFTNIDEQGRELSRSEFSSDPTAINRSLASNSRLVHSSMMYRRDSAEVFHGYDEKFDYAQDFALWLSLSEVGALTAIPEHLTKLRRLSNSMTLGREYSLNLVSDAYVLYRRAQGLEGLRVIDRLKGMRTIGLYGLLYAWRSLRAGNVVRAIGLIITNFWAIPLAIIELLRKSLKSFKTVK
jgi:glycosyltransferase involved in cell wall biosynthesis